VAVVATLSKGYDLDYIWRQVDRGPAKDAVSYYIQASESGGEPPGRWWGPGAKALGFEHGQTVERQPYDLLFGQRKAPNGTPLGRVSGGGRTAATCTRSCWVPSRMPPRSAAANSASKPPATPAKAPCSST
jgi:TrwC relaxase